MWLLGFHLVMWLSICHLMWHLGFHLVMWLSGFCLVMWPSAHSHSLMWPSTLGLSGFHKWCGFASFWFSRGTEKNKNRCKLVLIQVWFPSVTSDFSPSQPLLCTLSYSVCTTPVCTSVHLFKIPNTGHHTILWTPYQRCWRTWTCHLYRTDGERITSPHLPLQNCCRSHPSHSSRIISDTCAEQEAD